VWVSSLFLTQLRVGGPAVAKDSTSQALAPTLLSAGRPITAEDVDIVVSQLNYAYANASHTHISLATGTAAWGTSGNEESTHGILLDDASYTTYYEFSIYVDVDVSTLTWGANVSRGGGDDGNVRMTVGSATASVLSWSSSTGDGWQSADITVHANDDDGEWVSCTLELQRTSGSNNDASLIAWYIENKAPASIPDPPDE